MSWLLAGRQTKMPPVCTTRSFGDPATDPFARLAQDPAKDDLESLFGGDEDDIFRGVDFEALDIDDVDLSVFESSYDSEDDSDGECLNSKFRESRNHDCMWGGQCCNKEYQRTQVIPQRPPAPPSVVYTRSSQEKVVTIQKCAPSGNSDRTDVVVVTNSAPRTVLKTEGRSLLLNRTTYTQQRTPPSPVVKQEIKQEVKQEIKQEFKQEIKQEIKQDIKLEIKQEIKQEPPTPQSSRPETPQSLSGSDEDDFGPIPIETHQNAAGIFRSALNALTTPVPANWEDGLLDFGTKRTKVEPARSQTDLLRLCASATSDHNYDGSSKALRLEGLGVDTPSDSEEDEEIDVVSLSDRSSSSRSSSCGRLPTRPTARDQETLEEIATSLLSASEAVSRKLKREAVRQKRKKYRSESSDDDDEEEDEEDEEEESETSERYEDYEPPVAPRAYRRQHKRARASPNRERKKKSSRFGDEDSKEKRDQHNNMERMRRIDLRISFDELKALVPGVANKERAAKVVILREAAQFCSELGAESQSKQMQVQALRKEQMRLRAMVSSLRKAAAMAMKHY